MSLNFTVQPGKVWSTGEKITTAKLNQTAVPVITAEGVTSPTDMAVADYSAVIGPGAYVYAAATLSGANYTADYSPDIATYTEGLWLAFKTAVTNPVNATFNAGAGAKPLYAAAGTRVPDPAEIPANSIVQVRYNTSLNSGAGGWQILSVLRDRAQAEFAGSTTATGGERGLVPAPRAGEADYALRGDGTFRSLTPDIETVVDASIAANNASAQILPLYMSVNH
jgi:hypothetical protein